MTSKRNLGPAIALTGAGIAVAAVIAGFVVVGGPGDARERRLDAMTIGRITDMMNIVQCAFNGTGVAPASFADALNATGWTDQNRSNVACRLGIESSYFAAADTDTPTTPGSATYKALGSDSVRVCANFRRPYEGEECEGVCYGSTEYTEWLEPRPSGVVCRDSVLEKTDVNRPFNLSH